MAGAKEIRTKISSINKTRKITRAMEMVAASKMRKTQDKMRATRPYANKIYDVIKHIARASSEYQHPFMKAREIKRVGLIVVSTDKGLCGGLNANLLRDTVRNMKDLQTKGTEIDLAILGRKGQTFFKRVGGNIVAHIDGFGDKPSISDFIGLVKVMTDAFHNSTIDAVHIVYNEFVNTITQKPVMKQLLPLPTATKDAELMGHHWDYIYEPDSKEVLDDLLERYIELQVYQAVVENIACEQAAKMMAMQNATKNAGELIKEFQLAYNKARQAAITQELAEIAGGAAAL